MPHSFPITTFCTYCKQVLQSEEEKAIGFHTDCGKEVDTFQLQNQEAQLRSTKEFLKKNKIHMRKEEEMLYAWLSPHQWELYLAYGTHHYDVLRRATWYELKNKLQLLIEDKGDYWTLYGVHYPKKNNFWTKNRVILALFADENVKSFVEGYEGQGYRYWLGRVVHIDPTSIYAVLGETYRGWEVQRPHSDKCNGFAELAEPDHIVCTKCSTEVKMWDYGISNFDFENDHANRPGMVSYSTFDPFFNNHHLFNED